MHRRVNSLGPLAAAGEFNLIKDVSFHEALLLWSLAHPRMDKKEMETDRARRDRARTTLMTPTFLFAYHMRELQ